MTAPRLPEPVATPDPGLFGPDSVTWRVHADVTMGIAGIRALLLQALHPLAMAGVAQHSDFRGDPWGRLMRTAEYVGVTTFGTTLDASRAGARVRGIHRRLAGIEPESGQTYRVDDPALLLWVHCCEAESFLTTAVRAGMRLSRAERDQYYDEQRRAAALVGLDPDDVPGSVAAVNAYFRAVRPSLRVTSAARDTVRFVFWPPMPPRVAVATPARPAWVGIATTAYALLPRWARRMYALPGLPVTDVSASLLVAGLRTALFAVPPRLRHGPHVRAARERLEW